MVAQTPRSRSRPLVWLGAVCVALGVAARVGQVDAVANIGLLPTPLPFAVETHPLELSPSLFAHERPIANASVSFAPTGATQTTLGDIPFPTGAWWTNLVLDKGDNPVSTMPYMFKVEGGKLKVGYPFRVVLPRIIQNGFVSEIIVTGNAKSRWQQQVVGFDAFGVALQFTAPQQPDAGSFTTYLVRGSPYVTTEFNNAVPVIESSDGIKIQRLKRLDQTMVDMKGKPLQFAVYALQNSNGHLWYVFGSDQTLELTLQGGKVQASTKFTGVIRIALALTVDAAPLLLESAPVYAVGGDVKYEVDTANQVATVEFAWKTKTFPGVATNASKLLMLALPHHNDTLVPSSVTLLDDLRYTAIRGIMVGVLGDAWKMEEPLPEIEWSYPTNQGLFNTTDDADKAKREEMAKTATAMIAESLQQDILTFPHLAVDSYGFGKQMGRETRLLLIADAIGQKEAFNHQLEKIKTEIEPWLSATNGDALVYDERYGGLVTKNGMRDQNADFGNGYYNDHHFHYGYYMHGLAVLRKFAPEFLEKHAAAAAMLIADIGTPLDSTPTKFFKDFPARHYFPSARHKDWFVGHSYASGIFQMQVGKSQESSSECINAYYGMALFGSLDENGASDPLSYYNYARMMLALELRGTKKYWHMRENSKVYEPIFAKNAMVGVLGEMNAVYNTWFGDRPEYMHGINMIPFTPISSQLMNEAYVVREYDQIRPSYELLEAGDVWKSIIIMDHAILDAAAAWSELVNDVTAYDTWNSKTNALLWIATRPSWYSQKDRTILTTPDFHDSDKCFGYPACSTAGENGTSLACCDTLPGCCPSPLGCCPQKDPSQVPLNACMGEHQCAVLGLGCCNSIDGCCEPDPFTGTVLGCCKDQTVRPVATTKAPTPASNSSSSSGFCTDQPKCAAAGLLCCDTEAGCCTPDPITGGQLDCCVAPPQAIATCHSQPKCAALDLLCCGTTEGCCKPDPVSGGVLDCCIETSKADHPQAAPTTVSPDDVSTCHQQPLCAEAGLDCCSSAQGCCEPDPVYGAVLGCCQLETKTSIPEPVPTTPVEDPFGTCHGDTACLTAGANGTALMCCATEKGCCPGLLCCSPSSGDGEATTTTTGTSNGDDETPKPASKTSVALVIVLSVVVVALLAYALATCYRRRNYAPLDQDSRAWYCGALMLVVAAFFVYLVVIA